MTINTEKAIENSDYIKERLSNHFTIDQRKSEHEFIIDLEVYYDCK